jgi:hypothetical protein
VDRAGNRAEELLAAECELMAVWMMDEIFGEITPRLTSSELEELAVLCEGALTARGVAPHLALAVAAELRRRAQREAVEQ